MIATYPKSIAVFCGSQIGAQPVYAEAARELAQALVAADKTLVYGGGEVGLMGIIADTMLQAGGKVIGVIPESLARHEIMHAGVTEMHVVKTMAERKTLITELSEGFICLPGGIGSMDELFEIMVLRKLKYHHHPIGLLNTNHFYDHLLHFMDVMIQEDFVARQHWDAVYVSKSPLALLEQFEQYASKRQELLGAVPVDA
jgi:uncharacterized protein (TIGR00730 family)